MILIAPSKKMKIYRETMKKAESKPFFISKAHRIRKYLENLSKEELSCELKISNKVLDDTFQMYRSHTCSKALFSYSGVVFKELSIKNYSLEYLQKNIFVLDAMYGIINALDDINLYRLDFSKKINDINLYNYWRAEVNLYISSYDAEKILNLASLEYSKLVKFETLNKDVYNIHFDKKIVSSVEKKQIRGKILNYCIVNKVQDYDLLDNIEIDNYILALSDREILIRRNI